MCNHETCSNIRRENPNINATGCVLFKETRNGKVIFLGLETQGPRAGQYNICVGGMDPGDNNCYLANLRRELLEEFGVNTSFSPSYSPGKIYYGSEPSTFDLIFKVPYGRFVYTIFRNVVVFMGVMPEETTRNLFNTSINNNRHLGPTYNEMAYINTFNSNFLPVDNKFPVYPITEIAQHVIHEFKRMRFI